MFFDRSKIVSVGFGCAVVVLATLLISTLRTNAGEKRGHSVLATSAIEDNLAALLVCHDTPREPELPAEAEEVVAEYDLAAAKIRHQAALEIREQRLQALRRLKALQDTHTRAAELDQAVAVRDTIRQMLEASFQSISNPGTMSSYANQVGKSFLIRVTGRITGSVYGTDYFTCDSDIATACVHSGALRDGESGVIVVKIIAAGQRHIGSVKHAVRSYDYGVYPASFKVQRWKPSLEEVVLGSLKLE